MLLNLPVGQGVNNVSEASYRRIPHHSHSPRWLTTARAGSSVRGGIVRKKFGLEKIAASIRNYRIQFFCIACSQNF